MAALPSPTQVAGSHAAIYEAYYNQVDPNGLGRIGALEAARFLKKSQLSDVILSKIWDMADPQSRGVLDKSGLFVALKLCALAQAGQDLSMANLNLDMPPPKMGDIPIIPKKPPIPTPPLISSVNNGDWSIKPTERAKYDQLFDSLQPSNGYIPGHKVKGVLMDSKLPLDTLGKIWDLADMDKDGMLDRHEFVIAMHLVYKALEKYAIPSVLPPELMPPGKRKDSIPMSKSPVPVVPVPVPIPMNTVVAPPPIPPLPTVGAMKPMSGLETMKPPSMQPQWVVSIEDQIAAEKLFIQADLDKDGFVSGAEIKDIFLQSGLPQIVLAQIWSLCDTTQTGQLNKELFALAMWLIKQKLRGIDPPPSLTPEMIPPSMRKPVEGVVENNNISGYSNPELDMISKDIAELARERNTMEQDIAQKEADIKIKNTEIKNLQSELDTLAATLRQLENQRGEAQKRLNDLKAQKADIDRDLSEIELEICEELKKVDKLRQQAEEQESVLRTQEEELNSKRQELEGLKQEEQQLEQQQSKSRDQLNDLTKKLQDTQLQISQAKAKITHLEEQQRQMNDAIALYDSALAAGDATLVPDTSLHFKPEIEEEESEAETKSIPQVNGVQDGRGDAFSHANGPGASDAFGDQDPFASNKAKEAFGASTPDPFASAFPSQPAAGGFASDPFAAFDSGNPTKQDPFDPFGDKQRADAKTPSASATKDPFGDDPFANLHAPIRPESPSPALPPKKAKQPPPRPAPPRPSQGPSGPMRAAPVPPTPTPDPFSNANSDPFAAKSVTDNNNSGFGTTGFADFANFDSKPELTYNRATPPKPLNRPSTTSSSSLNASKLPDFTEDPFSDYRYEDPFNITDPFADDNDDLNANARASETRTDPFGFSDSAVPNRSKDAFVKGFETDFANLKLRTDNRQSTGFDADFGKAFADDNRNVRTATTDMDFAKSKAVDIDEAFSSKTDKTGGKRFVNELAHGIKEKLGYDKKSKSSAFGRTWNATDLPVNMTEERQLAWAAKESLEAEKERRRRKEREDADLALALEISKRDKSGKL